MCDALIAPPYAFAPRESRALVVKAVQFEHPELPTWTLISLADVAPHTLLLEESKLKLKE
jgi:hypothetical protein